mmetsp:Transcript_12077/g.18549  ORF Transcript_12077/g.18549 Transcript_12077/m.18549 type:complete len:207 (-) Transcript_12077:1025-1645(-)
MTGDISGSIQLWQDLLCKSLTQLNTPLVKCIDIPHCSLCENFHFVHGDQDTKHTGSKLLEEEGGGWTVPLKDFVWHKCFDCLVRHFALEFCTNLISRLTHCHGLCLGKIVGKKNGVVINWGTEILSNIVLCLDGRQEVTGDELCSLVDQLVKGMLPIGSRLTPNDGSCLDIHLLPIPTNVLSIRFHITLLKVCRKTMHVLVIWQNR